ncbi:MAG TPA: hypothetical protein VFP60_14015 [Pseudolabrys sp.]|nr:hypothetical protein [Pseudolabrys sp.]
MRPVLIGALMVSLAGCACQQQLPHSSFSKAEKTVAKKEIRSHRRKSIRHAHAAKIRASSSDSSEAAIKKAKAKVAAKMELPASVEFVDMKRAARKTSTGDSIDTVCGHVRGKNKAGGETGERPFLYLVHEDEAYVGVYILTSPYRDLCN